MEQTDMDDLLSKIVLKTPANRHMEEIGEILARKRAASRRNETFRHRLTLWGVAASVVVITVVSSLIHFSETDFESGGEELVHLLPDNSEVIVMPDSRVSYNRFTWLFNRRVRLEGEAVFSVTHGPRFSVGTRQGEVVVLGTRFRVNTTCWWCATRDRCGSSFPSGNWCSNPARKSFTTRPASGFRTLPSRCRPSCRSMPFRSKRSSGASKRSSASR